MVLGECVPVPESFGGCTCRVSVGEDINKSHDSFPILVPARREVTTQNCICHTITDYMQFYTSQIHSLP